MPNPLLQSMSPLRDSVTKLASLALELYHLIIYHVDEKRDLRSMALCCSGFRDEAQRHLFRQVDPKSLTQQTLFLSAINSQALRLGPLVHTFCLDQRWWRLGDALEFLSIALQAMCGLKYFEIRWATPSTFLRGCTFQLRAFVSGYTLDRTEAEFLLSSFLPTQRHIKHLMLLLNNNIDDIFVPMGLCPQLDSLGVNDNRLIRDILPQTKLIHHFQWSNYFTPPSLTIHQLANLKSILLCRYMPAMDTSLIPHLTSLVYLNLKVTVQNPEGLLVHVGFLSE